MPQEKDYFAFISYQRKDEEWADRLRNKLEHYRLPSSVRKQNASLPKEIRPIFRDALELAGGVLAKEIETALQQSKFLIVICSPNSAKSPWVNKEIQTFIDLGREDRIIPFIIDGTPFSDNEDTECFPSALRSLKDEKELLGININELSRDAAAIKVVARMFGLKFDTLWQRYEREKKKKRWTIIGGALLFALFGISIGGYFVKQNRLIENQNAQLENAAKRLKDDAVTLSNHILRIQNDSLLLSSQKDSIQRTNKLLEETNFNLEKAYDGLRRANHEILKSNWSLKISNAKILTERAVEKMEDGDAVNGINLLKQLCANSDIDKLRLLPEVEKSLRMAYGYQFKKGINGFLVLEDIGEITLAGFCDNDKSIYAVVNDTCVVKYDTTTGMFKGVVGVVPHLESSENDMYVYGYDDNSKCVLFSFDNTVYLYDIINGRNTIDPIIAPSFVDHVVVSSSYDYIGYSVELPDDRPYEWHVAKLNNLPKEDYIIPDCEMIYAFSPDGKKCLVEIGSTYYIYDVTKRDTCFQVHSNYINDAHFCSNGDYIVINTKKYNKEKGYGEIQEMKVFSMLKRDYIHYGDDISEDGYFPPVFREGPKDNFYVSGNHDGEIKVYTNISPPDKIDRIPGSILYNNTVYNLPGHNESINHIEFNQRGTSMLSVSERMIRLWNVNFQTSLELINKLYSYIVPSGNLFIGETDNKKMAVADVENHNMIGAPLYGIDSKLTPKLVSRNGEAVVATKDSLVYVLRPVDNEGFRIRLHEPAIYSRFSINKDGSLFAIFTKGDGEIPSSLSIYDTKKQKELVWVDSIMIFNISISPNGKNIVVAHYNKTEIRDVGTLKVTHSLVGGHTGYVKGLAFSPDGTLIASFGSDNVLCIWDANSGKLKKKFPSIRYQFNTTGGFSFSPDNKYVMASLNQSESISTKKLIYVWNIETGEVVDSYEDISSCWFCQDIPWRMYYQGEFAGYYFRDFPTLEQIVNYLRR